MILPWIILFTAIGALLALVAGRVNETLPRYVSLAALGLHMVGLIVIWVSYLAGGATTQGPWIYEYTAPWIPQLGISIHLALDGVSLLLVLLTNFLGIIAVAASWEGIHYRVGFFHFNLLWILAAINGVFLSIDLFLFYFFWEMMLIPLYLLIGIWGHESRIYATLKFFIFTQAASLFMMLAIIGLYLLHGRDTGTYTFDYMQLLGTRLDPTTAFWLMLGFFVAFAVKLPMVPLHTWLPDAHTEAPTAGSVDLAGLVLKVGAYGFLRFVIPLFPAAAFAFAPVAMALGAFGILYAALVAFGQTDLKRLVAYTSVSHMGFVLIGIFAWNELGLQGAVLIMLAHGISTGALFVLAGDLQDRMHTREMGAMGGLYSILPRMGGTMQFFAVASLGLPGLGNFVGEILVLFGVYRVYPAIAVIASLGFIVSTIYALWMVQRVFFGPNVHGWKLADQNPREFAIMGALIVVITWLGLYPQTFLNTGRQALVNLQQLTRQAQQAGAPPVAPDAAAPEPAASSSTARTLGGSQ